MAIDIESFVFSVVTLAVSVPLREGSEGLAIQGALRSTMAWVHWLGGPRAVPSEKFLTCHRKELVCGRGRCRGVFDEDDCAVSISEGGSHTGV